MYTAGHLENARIYQCSASKIIFCCSILYQRSDEGWKVEWSFCKFVSSIDIIGSDWHCIRQVTGARVCCLRETRAACRLPASSEPGSPINQKRLVFPRTSQARQAPSGSMDRRCARCAARGAKIRECRAQQRRHARSNNSSARACHLRALSPPVTYVERRARARDGDERTAGDPCCCVCGEHARGCVMADGRLRLWAATYVHAAGQLCTGVLQG